MNRRTFLLTPLALVAAERKPNILLFLATGWRAQATPWAGDSYLSAPNLERFGRQGVVFDRAYSCYPRSKPARAALATGRFPHTIGVIHDDDRLPSGEVTLDAVLKSAGYAVGEVPSSGAAEFLRGHQKGAFFLTVLLEAAAAPPEDPAQLHPRENVPSSDEPAARQQLAVRYGEYTALDSSAGQVLASLEALGLAGNTITVFTSDHGEQMGSQGLNGDDVAFEESVRIPLAIQYPGVLKDGTKSELLVSQVDLMPTLLAWCGVAPPEGLQGRDLSALISGAAGEPPESIFAEGKIGDKDEWRMLVLGFDKIVVNLQTEITHLYNLADDPYELTNLARDPAMRLKRDILLAALRASERRLSDFKRR